MFQSQPKTDKNKNNDDEEKFDIGKMWNGWFGGQPQKNEKKGRSENPPESPSTTTASPSLKHFEVLEEENKKDRLPQDAIAENDGRNLDDENGTQKNNNAASKEDKKDQKEEKKNDKNSPQHPERRTSFLGWFGGGGGENNDKQSRRNSQTTPPAATIKAKEEDGVEVLLEALLLGPSTPVQKTTTTKSVEANEKDIEIHEDKMKAKEKAKSDEVARKHINPISMEGGGGIAAARKTQQQQQQSNTPSILPSGGIAAVAAAAARKKQQQQQSDSDPILPAGGIAAAATR